MKTDEWGEEVTCLNAHKSDCQGEVEYHASLAGTGTSIPRCDKHYMEHLDNDDRIRERYPVLQPSDFDPSYAGERWDDDY